MKIKKSYDEESEEYKEYERKVLKKVNRLILLATFIGLLGVGVLAIDGANPAILNYGDPAKIFMTEDNKITIELVSIPYRTGRYPGGYEITAFLNYDGETFRCPCGGLPFCNKEFYKRTKKFRLRSATVQIADGKKKIWFIGGKRYCRIIDWEYLFQKDREFIEIINKRRNL